MNLPERVCIVEVCPRDGFQNIKELIPTQDKTAIIKKLIDSGLSSIEVTSFVHPKWVPQMADAVQVVKEIREYVKDSKVQLIALVPNKYGAVKAIEAGVDWITYVISASEKHNMNNINRTIEQSFKELEEIAGSTDSVKIRLAIATAFGCPFGEEISAEKIVGMAERGLELGAQKIILADTIGAANPLQVEHVIRKVKEYIDVDLVGMHLHDTRGMGIANVLVGLCEGITYLESALGGLGGCPYAPGAAGNIATEDLVNMLHSMKIDTQVDIDGLYQALELLKEKVNAPIVSHMSKVSCS